LYLQERDDDHVALVHSLLYGLHGYLPWQGHSIQQHLQMKLYPLLAFAKALKGSAKVHQQLVSELITYNSQACLFNVRNQ